MKTKKIGFGGGCHWCTEAVFQHLKGVQTVEQGWIASINENDTFSEAVIVHFDEEQITLEVLIEVHLHTHSSMSSHSMRTKYRSAVYTYSEEQASQAENSIHALQHKFNNSLITKVHPFVAFKPSPTEQQNYFLKNPKKPFCERHIIPKLTMIEERFGDRVKLDRKLG